MHDEWWDDEDDETIAALQRELAPLREPPRPWGDLLARARFTVAQERRAPSVGRWTGVVAGVAAALFVGWLAGRASWPEVVEYGPAMNVAAPYVEPSPPIIVPMPVPVPIDPSALLESVELARDLRKIEMEADREAAKKRSRRPAAAPKEELHVDCILDPALAECMKRAVPQGDDPPQGDDLPDVLNATDIKAAIQKVEAQAKACGPEHGAKSGEKVKIKLTLEGATGRVTATFAQSPHDETELGRCVADVLATARFPRFRKPRLGVVYPVTM